MSPRLPPALLGAWARDSKYSCLVVGGGGRREGVTLLLLLFHLVQEHGILNLSIQRRRENR